MPTPETSPPAGPSGPTAVEAALQARNRQIAAVHTITRLLSSTLDLDVRLRDILSVSMQAVDAAAGSILLYRPSDEKLVFQYVVGPKARELTGYAMPVADGVAGRVFTSGQPAVTNQPGETPGHRSDIGQNLGFPSRNILTVPLQYRDGRPVGVMQLVNKQEGAFESDDLEVLEILAAVAASAIENAQRHRSAQMEAVAHAVADMSHHIKNKVTPISVASDTLEQIVEGMLGEVEAVCQDSCARIADRLREAAAPVKDFMPESHQIILDQVNEIQHYTRVVSDALRGIVSEPQLQPHDLARIVERQLVALDALAQKRGVRIARDLGPVPMSRIDRSQVESAVYHLVSNAVEATPEGGVVTVTTRAITTGKFPKGSCALIEVADTGTGMPAALLESVLSGEGRSTKPGRTGLGTRIAFYAAQAHHGSLEGSSQEGTGTTLRLRLPLRGMALVQPPLAPPSEPLVAK